jgi:MFS family permease
LVYDQVAVLLLCIFLMGLHSTLFGPVKFALLPQVLSEQELTGGNGMVEMGTFVAILMGNVVGGLLVAIPSIGQETVAAACLVMAVAGRAVAGYIPSTPATDPSLKINWNPISETLAQPPTGARRSGRVPLTAGHQLDVVFWCGVPEPVPHSGQRGVARQRAGGIAAAGGFFHRYRHRLSSV